MGHGYGRIGAGKLGPRSANPLPDGGRRLFFLASCLSNQCDLLGKRHTVREDRSRTDANRPARVYGLVPLSEPKSQPLSSR